MKRGSEFGKSLEDVEVKVVEGGDVMLVLSLILNNQKG